MSHFLNVSTDFYQASGTDVNLKNQLNKGVNLLLAYVESYRKKGISDTLARVVLSRTN